MSFYRVAAFSAAVVVIAAPLAASTVSGTATYRLTGDLTLISSGGSMLEFLDLTATTGLTASEAIGLHGAAGFSWATPAEVTTLLDAFGLGSVTTDATAWNRGIRSVDIDAVRRFHEAIGVTYTSGSQSYAIGYVDDGDASSGGSGLVNVRDLSGDGSIFVNHHDFGDGDNGGARGNIGYFLVRPAPSVTRSDPVPTVPGPAAAVSLGAALFGLVVLRRRRRTA